MSAADPALPEEDELIAAELAFGLLDEADRRAAEARTAADPAFAAAWARWQDHAVALLAGPEESPRPSVWTRIEARLPANDTAATLSAASSLRWWRGGALVASAAAVVFAIVAVDRNPMTPPPPRIALAPAAPPMLAVLTAAEGKGALAVSYDPASRRITASPAGMAIGRHSAELWVIPADGKPRSLGVVADSRVGRTTAPASAAAMIAAGVTLAISIEPIGGSPTGLPTGKVILTGKMAAA